MNGDDLWNALNYVNEEYLDDADKMPVHRVAYWKPAAIAAVLVCVIGASFWMRYTPAPEAESNMAEDNAMPLMRSRMAPEEMTVQVVSREEGILICTVVESDRYEPGVRLKIVPPEEQTAVSRKRAAGETLLHVTYWPQEGETITALEIMPEENVSDS